MRGAKGSGSQRLYSFQDILLLKVVKRLLDAGISLQQIRTAVQHLRERGTDDLTRVTLMSDGVSVYECTNNDEIIDLLQGGQGVFGIAIGGVWSEIEGTLAELPSERTAAAEPSPSRRRARRAPRSPQDRLRSRRATPDLIRARPPAHPVRPRPVAIVAAGRSRARSRVPGRLALLTLPHGRVPGARRPGRRRGNSSPEPLRHQDRAGQAL